MAMTQKTAMDRLDRWSGHIRMERRSTVTQMISNEFDLCKQVWIRVVDPGYGSLVRREYGSGPCILSCVHRYWRNTLFCNVHLQIKISLTCIRIFLYSGQKVYNFICLRFLHVVTSSSHVHVQYMVHGKSISQETRQRGTRSLGLERAMGSFSPLKVRTPTLLVMGPRDSGGSWSKKKKLRHY